MTTTGEQRVLQKIANMFKANTPQSVKQEVKQEAITPTVAATLPLRENSKQEEKKPIPGSVNWYPSSLKTNKKRKENTKGHLVNVLKKAKGCDDWEPQGKKVKKRLSYSTMKNAQGPESEPIMKQNKRR